MATPRFSRYICLRVAKGVAVALFALSALALVGLVGINCSRWYANHNFKTLQDAFEFGKQCGVIKLVYCNRDMPVGSLVTNDCLSTCYWWEPMYPQDAISEYRDVIGQRVVYGIQKDQIACYHDVRRDHQ